jgi:hypothetical protein
VAQHLATHVGPRLVPHGSGELSNELAARVVAVLQV